MQDLISQSQMLKVFNEEVTHSMSENQENVE